MIDHFTLTVADIGASRAFYEHALAPLGYSVQMEYEQFVGFGARGKPSFWLKPGPMPQSPMHIAFVASDRPRVDAFYAAALAAGGRDDGAPGLRPDYHPNYYGAFVIDPNGHPIEAVCHQPLTISVAGAKVKATKKKPAPKTKKPAPKTKKRAPKKKSAKRRRR
jgi:catechol 2,3-dioxygenase-like lactoylglutathione lyase family enzyme